MSPKKPSSLHLERVLKNLQNLPKPSSPPLRVWKTPLLSSNNDDDDDKDVRNHPVLRTLASTASSPPLLAQTLTQFLVSGLAHHSLASASAIKSLCSSSSPSSAASLFSLLPHPDAFLGNTVLRSFVNSNRPDLALHFYRSQFVPCYILPNHFTFPLLFKSFATLRLVLEGEKTHSLASKFGLDSDLFVQNSLIHMYFAFSSVDSARRLFDAHLVSDLVTWNTMIDGYAKNGGVDVARSVFDEMPERDLFSWNSMIAGYVGVEDMGSAKEVFDAMPMRDVVSWNCMIDGYAKIGEVSLARAMFDAMPKRNVVSWNVMLALYVRRKEYGECLRLFDRMTEDGEVEPNSASFVSILTACANLGSLEKGKWVHSYIRNNKRIQCDVLLLTSLLTMYAKCGDMCLAKEIFDSMPERSVVSWNSLIMGYGIHGHGEKALKMFLEMEKRGPRPNDATFICILSACTHGGMVLEGWYYFDLMRRVYNIEPKVEHYGCMVDLLGRAGLLSDSEEIINKMTVKPTAPALWGALMSACGTHANCELGETIGKKLIELEPNDVGPYVLLSNIYASEQRWDDVEKVRKLMRDKGLLKTTGSSRVDLGCSEHQPFFQNNPPHKKRLVYSMLGQMGALMKLPCYKVDEMQGSVL